jgi:hypothetical protein
MGDLGVVKTDLNTVAGPRDFTAQERYHQEYGPQ